MAKATKQIKVSLELTESEAFAIRVFLRDFLDLKGYSKEISVVGSFARSAWNVVEVLEKIDQEEK